VSSGSTQKKLARAMQHQRAGELGAAEVLYREVLAGEPRQLVALHLLSATLLETGRDAEAAGWLERAIEHAPGQAIFLANLGEAYRRLGRLPDATARLRRAVALKPDLAEAYFTLGRVSYAEGRRDEALASYRSAALLKPGLLQAHTSLAAACIDVGRVDDALEACSRALSIDPRFAEAHNWRGLALRELGRLAEALDAFRTALDCQPDYPAAHSNLVYAMMLSPDFGPRAIAEEAARWSERHAAPRAARLALTRDREPDRRLRVGYVSPHFFNHCHCLFLLPLFRHHDRTQVEVFAYSSVERPDGFTQRVRDACDGFRDIVALGDAQAAELVRSDGVDVLVDVAMHLSGGRLRTFAFKPAPVQVTWLAYPGTTGLGAMDYRLTDVFLDPPGADDAGAYTEESVRLPETFWCYDPLTDEPSPGPLPALGNGHVTFGALNSFAKTGDATFAVWAQILRATSGSRLVLLARAGASREQVRRAFAGRDVDPGRIEFVDYRPRDEYLAQYRRIDIALDTFPHNGGTTSLDALWMGVPVITLVGRTVVGRAGACYAANLGLPELATAGPGEYVEAAVGLARDVARLERLRGELRARMHRSPLMDAPRFARNLESAYRGLWRRRCATGD
jgi:protein O-GlcNAc transferase